MRNIRRDPRMQLHKNLQLAVEWFGKDYLAWLERWTRRVWTTAGEASFSAQLIVSYKRGRRERNRAIELRNRLWRWGYRRIQVRPLPVLHPSPEVANLTPANVE